MGESECFRIDSAIRQGFIMSFFLFKFYMDVVMKEVKMWVENMGVKFLEEGREWGLSVLSYADNLALYGE